MPEDSTWSVLHDQVDRIIEEVWIRFKTRSNQPTRQYSAKQQNECCSDTLSLSLALSFLTLSLSCSNYARSSAHLATFGCEYSFSTSTSRRNWLIDLALSPAYVLMDTFRCAYDPIHMSPNALVPILICTSISVYLTFHLSFLFTCCRSWSPSLLLRDSPVDV